MSRAPLHFLLVEDDDAHASLVERAMRENRVANTMDRVKDGEEALAYLRRDARQPPGRRPDVVLLDLKIPRIDGHEVLAAMKSDKALRVIPVVVLSTSDSEADRVRAYSNYANSYLAKPLDFSRFQQMVRDLKLYWCVWNRPADT